MSQDRHPSPKAGPDAGWPPLPLAEWKDTLATLHMWTQVVGKVRLACSPLVNHWWGVPLYVSARGLTTSLIPYGRSGFEIEFDLVEHALRIEAVDGRVRTVALTARPVAEFYREVMAGLSALGFEIEIFTVPSEQQDAIPFEQDFQHASYEREAVDRFRRALFQAYRLLSEFRAPFLGKASPVHFFWGSFDLAVTRFSGRRAPPHPGGIPHLPRSVVLEAYSHEVSSAGWWPGNESLGAPAFYSYAYPEPEGFGKDPVSPAGAFYSTELHEFLLPEKAVRAAPDADAAVLDFLQSTYDRAATLAGWDRGALERTAAPAPGLGPTPPRG